MGYFSRGLFEFFEELEANNDREWFNANKERFEREVKEPFLEFISDAQAPLRMVSPNLVADPRPVGGSLFRIHRDVRFAKDKSPYKTNAGAHFPLGGKDVHGPGYYLHLDPGQSFVAGGMWMPSPEALRAIRVRIAEKPAEWEGVRGDLDHPEDALKRPPQGFDPDHPMIEDLKRKSFTASRRLTRKQVMANDLMDTFIESCQRIAPMMRFLAAANGVPWT